MEHLEKKKSLCNRFYIRVGKRIFDFFVSLIAIILLLPVFFIIAILVKLSSPGPIIFKQKRMGKNFKEFTLYKFRTMRQGSEKRGAGVTYSGDPRITPIGSFLRKTKLDELPQFFNVLRGDMSLVGPRAVLKKFVDPFRDDYKEILVVKPGLTDYATLMFTEEEELLRGKGGTPREIENYYIKNIHAKKVELYKKYVREISFGTDIKILFLTAVKVLKGIWNRIFKVEIEKILYWLGDGLMLLAAYISAFYLRFEFHIPPKHIVNLHKGLPFFVLIGMFSFTFFRIYKIGWKPSSVNLVELLKAVGLTMLLFGMLILGLRHSYFYSFPRSIILLAPIIATAYIKGYRIIVDQFRHFTEGGRRVLLIGVGPEIDRVIDAINGSGKDFNVVGILSTRESDVGTSFDKIKVIGTLEEVSLIIEREEIDSLIILPYIDYRNYGNKILTAGKRVNLFYITPFYFYTIFPDQFGNWLEPFDESFIIRVSFPTIDFYEKLQHQFSGKKITIFGGKGAFLKNLIFQLALSGADEITIFDGDRDTLLEVKQLFSERCGNCKTRIIYKWLVDIEEDELDKFSMDFALFIPLSRDREYSLLDYRVIFYETLVKFSTIVRKFNLGNTPFVFFSNSFSDVGTFFEKVFRATEVIAESTVENLRIVRAGDLVDPDRGFFRYLLRMVDSGMDLDLTVENRETFFINPISAAMLLLNILGDSKAGYYIYYGDEKMELEALLHRLAAIKNSKIKIQVREGNVEFRPDYSINSLSRTDDKNIFYAPLEKHTIDLNRVFSNIDSGEDPEIVIKNIFGLN